ncbi:hypothetical protein A167_02356 [Alcanivorax sp. S71-1-4]|uniref:outer membrane beta-barrel protein n=1 Tax=Alcanivorax sp. S71-1-4 TaxID=1177159 RepID=UPI00135CEC8D|nr:outer membrane beta-barrel protein [Alcanivorax sp. S71-1-4]KAF0808889.1 hypothetical protein A167_02356 [Alcanivorax sp. S71-1-4]
MTAYKFLLLPLIAALPLTAVAQEDLAPPDVDLFLEAQYGGADLDDFGLASSADGYRLRAGLWLNSLSTRHLRFGLEAGLNQLARETTDSAFTRGPNAAELQQPSPPDSVDVVARDRLEVSGYELGGRMLVARYVYARAGLYIHRVKTRREEIRTLNYTSGSPQVFEPVPESDSTSGTGGYAGLGVLVPLASGISLAADYSLYQVDSEQVGTYGIGLNFTF